jgi:hypothetical protein
MCVFVYIFVFTFAFTGTGCRRAPPSGSATHSAAAEPRLVLWAWDRAEDLRFLSALPEQAVGVAYLQAKVVLHGPSVIVYRRAASLQLPAVSWQLPVVHIEAARDPLPVLQEGQRRELLRVLRLEAERAAKGRLQIDFEAKASQRSFYRQLLFELRRELGPRFPLSITALTSWCLRDRWLGDAPVDEIVPMFYRLGEAGPRLRAELQRGTDLAPECRGALGLITDEPMTPPPTPRRLYLFSPGSWSRESLTSARHKLGGAW